MPEKKECYYLFVPHFFEKRCSSFVRMSQPCPCIKTNQFLLKIFISIGGLHIALIGTLESSKKDNKCKNIIVIWNQSQSQLLHLNIQAQQKITTLPWHLKIAFQPSLNFCQKVSLPQAIFMRMRAVIIPRSMIQKQILRSILQGITISHKIPLLNLQTLQIPLPTPLDPRLKEIQEPLVVKPRGRPSGSLNKKRRRKSNDFERSTRRELSRFEHVERNILASRQPFQQRGIRRSGIHGRVVQRGQNQPQTRSDNSTLGNVTRIPTEMTCIFSI